VASDASPFILVAAVTTVLRDALQDEELAELVDEHFLIDLEVLLSRVEVELEARSRRSHLHVA
jgi:hypothetical protein